MVRVIPWKKEIDNTSWLEVVFAMTYIKNLYPTQAPE